MYNKCVKYYNTCSEKIRTLLTKKFGIYGPAMLSYAFHEHQRLWFERQFYANMSIGPFKLYDKLKLGCDERTPSFVPDCSTVEPFQTLFKRNNPQVQAPWEQGNSLRDTSQSVCNHNVDPRFFVNTPLGEKLKKLRIPEGIARTMTQGKCIPVHPMQRSPDNQRCLSWHVKGLCYDNCKKRYNHSPLSDAAKEEMHNYAKAMVL